MSVYASNIAENLLKIQAVKLNPSNPFTWASGMKSPIYCDNRATLSFPEVRTAIKDAFNDLISSKFPECQGIAGVATAGIPHGALVADKMELPFIYVRSSAKKHGLENRIEGRIVQGNKYVVIEDLVSTGGSSLDAVKAIRAAGGEVIGLVAIFTYGLETSVNNFKEAELTFYSLTNFEQLLKKAVEKAYIQPSEMKILQDWRIDPGLWSSKREKIDIV